MKNLAGKSIIDKISERFKADEASGATHLKPLREKALDQLQSMGLPHPKHEEYKFTNLTKALEKHINFELNTVAKEVSKADVESLRIKDLDAHYLVFINGEFNSEFSDQFNTEGLNISTLANPNDAAKQLLEANYDRLDIAEEDSFMAMNGALATDGAIIEVAKSQVIERPIFLQFINTKSSDVQTKSLIKLGENAQATFIEKVDTLEAEPSFSNHVVEIEVAQAANGKYYKLENDKPTSYHISGINVAQGKDSRFTTNTIALNGAMVRNNLNIRLEDEGCEAYMNGLYLLSGKTHVDNHTAVDHTKPNAYSNELYKGIMDDQSKGVFNGKIFVRQDAQQTNAFQSNKNILLTDDATVNTKPQLEIWADDVQCSHGCTTGQLDEDALFYLMARGIKRDSAMAMLLHAFASDVIDNLELEPLQAYIEEIISSRLEK